MALILTSYNIILPFVSLVRKRGTEPDTLTMIVFLTKWLLTGPATYSMGESSSCGALELKLKHSTLALASLGTATNRDGLYFKKPCMS